MKAHNIFKSILALSLAVASVSSCQEKINGGGSFTKGEAVKFSVGTEGSGTDTKAVYAGNTTTPGEKERINWQTGDLIRIYCEAVSEPSTKYADYSVMSVEASGAKSKAHIECAGGVGLRWGTGDHYFYAVYPSPASGGIATGIGGKTVSGNLTSDDQGNKGMTETSSGSGSYVVKPDLKWMMMTAKAGPYSETGAHAGADGVFLSFTPLTTAIEFTIYNGNKNAALDVNKIMLISENTQISGTFTVDLETEDGGYAQCTGTASDSKQVCIDFSSLGISLAKATGDGTANCKSLKFTFFLAPTTDVSDLTFKLYKNASDWMSTKLGYTDGSGVWFPCHKKSSVTGLIVPEGAQWTVKYAPDVQPWNQNGSNIGPIPELGVDPFVTSWDTGIDEEVTLTNPYNGHEYVEIGGLKWATCNIGAKSPKEYGWYFSWAGTTGYVRAGSKWVTAQGGSELSNGFTFANTRYNTAGVNTSWNKYIPTGQTGYWSGGGSPDNKLSLEPDDDAAHVNWGGSWRMPTQADFQTLYEACGGTGATPELPSANPGKGIYWVSKTQTYISDYAGVAGVLFCDGESKLFFVAAGYGVDGNFNGGGSDGRYWSKTVYSNLPSNAYRLGFQYGNVSPENVNARNQGFPVRPVSE